MNQATALNVLISPSCPLPAAGLIPVRPSPPECQACVWGDDLRRDYGSLRACGANMVISDPDQACRLLSACIACRANGKPTAPRMLVVTAAEPDGSERPLMAASTPSMQSTNEELLDAVRKLTAKPQAVPRSGGDPAHGGMAFGSLRRTREHIERQIAHKISLGELANVAGLSAGHFSRAFKQSVGVSPHRYVLGRRIAAAADLIRKTDRSLAEVALSVGFSDQSHFTRAFARAQGETPSAFRRKYR